MQSAVIQLKKLCVSPCRGGFVAMFILFGVNSIFKFKQSFSD